MDSRYDLCPSCGSCKRTVAKTCKKCSRLSENLNVIYAFDSQKISREWAFCFSGLFFGEGSAMIVRNNASFSAVLSIGLRDDDEEVILDIRKTLGGSIVRAKNIHKKNPKHGNQIRWKTTDTDHIVKVCGLIIENHAFPAKKLNDVYSVLDFCLWRKTFGRFWGQENLDEGYRKMISLSSSRKYRDVNVPE